MAIPKNCMSKTTERGQLLQKSVVLILMKWSEAPNCFMGLNIGYGDAAHTSHKLVYYLEENATSTAFIALAMFFND